MLSWKVVYFIRCQVRGGFENHSRRQPGIVLTPVKVSKRNPGVSASSSLCSVVHYGQHDVCPLCLPSSSSSFMTQCSGQQVEHFPVPYRLLTLYLHHNPFYLCYCTHFTQMLHIQGGTHTPGVCSICTCGLWPEQVSIPNLQTHFCCSGREPLLSAPLRLVIALNGPPLFLLQQHLIRLVTDDRQASSPTEPIPPSGIALALLDRCQDNYWLRSGPTSKLPVTQQ